MAGALLVIAAGLMVVGTFLIFDELDPRVLVASYVLCAVVSGVAGVLLMMRGSAANRVVRWLGGVAIGLALGITVPDEVEQAADFALDGAGPRNTVDKGFWPLLLVVFLAIAVAVVLVKGAGRQGAQPAQGGRLADRMAGGFLVPVGILLIAGPCLLVTKAGPTLSDWFQALFKGDPFYLAGMVVAVCGPIALGVAVLLFAGLGTRKQSVRMLGSITAGLVFSIALSNALGSVFSRMSFDLGAIGSVEVGGWMFVAALPLSFAATVASLVSNLGTPNAQPIRRPMPMAGYPGQPNPIAVQQFSPASQPFPASQAPTLQQPATQPPRLARVHDGRGEDGRPIVSRPQLNPNVRTAVLAYLESAPLVSAAHSFDLDEFAPGERDVPLNFRTDGVWVWPGAVPHYLNKHGVPPEPELLQHIADRGYRIGPVDEPAQQAAVRVITSA